MLALTLALGLLATIISRPSNEPNLTTNGLERQANGQAPLVDSNQAVPKEPLAELGVAPGNADANSAAAGQGGQ